MGIKHLVCSLALTMYLVVIYHAAHTGLAKRLQVGSDTLAGGLCFAEEPPHLGAGGVLWMVETCGECLLALYLLAAEQQGCQQEHCRI